MTETFRRAKEIQESLGALFNGSKGETGSDLIDASALASELLNEVLIAVYCQEMAGTPNGGTLPFFCGNGRFEMAQSLLETQKELGVAVQKDVLNRALRAVTDEKKALQKFEAYLRKQLDSVDNVE